MALKQTIDQARPANFADVLSRTGDALARLRAQHADGTLPLLRLPEKRDDIATILGYAALLRDGTSDVIFLGTGGSSLGGQAVAQLAGYAVPGVGALRDPPRIHFMDNLDPESYGALLQRLPLKTSRFVAVSKSGGTGETLMQTIAALDAVTAAKLDPHEHFLGITEPAKPEKSNGLRNMLGAYKIEMMEHDTGVGGRFSVLTNVGLLPAAVCGLDIGAIRAGAGDALAPVLANKPPAEVPAAVGAALAASLAGHKTISVMMPYADRLALFTKWYVQLWAESLGKDGKGTTPIGALGPVDQHSQLQLYIAGPRDKLFTVITGSPAGKGPRMTAELSKLASEPDFTGKSMGDLVAAQGRATAETLAKNGCPVRTIHLPQLDERHLGELLMHFMLETIIAAHLLGVDPFDQPAVEEGKVLAKTYLAESS
jgi:glucose-6-phosphate isomerase